MADVSVRPARASDAAEIARIQVDTWRTAYQTVLPAPVLEALDTSQAVAAWTDAITAPPDARHRVLVAVEAQWVVGFAASAPLADPQPDDVDPDTTIVVAPLLVEPRWGRRGHGSRLLAATVDLAVADGATRAQIWIPETDTASREFLVSAGWAPDGLVRALDTGAGELREARLHTVLGPVDEPAETPDPGVGSP